MGSKITDNKMEELSRKTAEALSPYLDGHDFLGIVFDDAGLATFGSVPVPEQMYILIKAYGELARRIGFNPTDIDYNELLRPQVEKEENVKG